MRTRIRSRCFFGTRGTGIRSTLSFARAECKYLYQRWLRFAARCKTSRVITLVGIDALLVLVTKRSRTNFNSAGQSDSFFFFQLCFSLSREHREEKKIIFISLFLAVSRRCITENVFEGSSRIENFSDRTKKKKERCTYLKILLGSIPAVILRGIFCCSSRDMLLSCRQKA